MTLIKENLVPTFITLLAGLIVTLAAVPLQNTDWAEGFRAGASERVAGVEAEGA